VPPFDVSAGAARLAVSALVPAAFAPESFFMNFPIKICFPDEFDSNSIEYNTGDVN